MAIFFFQAEDGIRDRNVTGVQTCALPISDSLSRPRWPIAVVERKGSVSRRTRPDMYSKATSSSFCWTRWRARCPAYPATTATASDVPHQREEKRRERRDQSAHAASRQRLA